MQSEKYYWRFVLGGLFVPSARNMPLHAPYWTIGANGFFRLFLLSLTDNTVSKTTVNRKYVTYSSTYNCNGTSYLINTRKYSGIYTSILKSTIDQLDVCEGMWGRVLVVFFNLHQKHYTEDSSAIRAFFKHVKDTIKRKYSVASVGHVWAREKNTSDSQHYHCALFLDASVFRTSYGVLRIVKKTWESVEDKNSVPRIDNPYMLVNSPESKKDVVYRLSYFAKEKTKGERPAQAKDYSTSRLKPISLAQDADMVENTTQRADYADKIAIKECFRVWQAMIEKNGNENNFSINSPTPITLEEVVQDLSQRFGSECIKSVKPVVP